MLTITGVGRWRQLRESADHHRIGQMTESSDRVSSALFAALVILKVCKELGHRHRCIHSSGTLDCRRKYQALHALLLAHN